MILGSPALAFNATIPKAITVKMNDFIKNKLMIFKFCYKISKISSLDEAIV